jgi:hypothetical protein
MLLSDHHKDLLIGGIIGFGSSVLIGAISGLMSRWWKWWDHRRDVRSELSHFRRLILNTTAYDKVSPLLANLRAFLLRNDNLLERPKVKRFFSDWLNDPSLEETGQHSKFGFSDGLQNWAVLRNDAENYLVW